MVLTSWTVSRTWGKKRKLILCVTVLPLNILLVLSRPLRLGLCTLDLNLQCCKSTCVAVEACPTYYWRVSSCAVAALIFWEPHLHPRHALCYMGCPLPQPSWGMPLAPLAPEKSPLRIVWFHTMQLQCLWEQETNKEGHQQPTSQVLSLLASFRVDTTPQNMDQESMGVNIAAEQGTQEPSSGYHLARALLFSNAKCICCVLISYLCWNTVPHWCFWKILTLPQHRSITKDRKQ